MEIIGIFLLFLGTFLPLAGLIVTFLSGLTMSGRPRFYTLLLGPAVTFALCLMFGGPISYNGNLLFAVFFGLFLVFLVFYYPILLLWYFVFALRKHLIGRQYVVNT
jgi:hypothetical protein